MNKKLNRVLIILISFSVLFSQSAIAGRIGGGRSVGMQRSVSKPMNNNYTRQANPQQTQPQAQQPQRQGMGAGTGALIGAAAGAAGGYMIGKSMANDNNTNNAVKTEQPNNSATNQDTVAQQNKSENNIPWGIIGILVALLVIGLTIFRRKTSPQLAQPNNLGGGNGFKIPGLNQNNSFQKASQQNGRFNANNNSAQMANVNDNRMPDGIEIQYFLRQAKGMFLHIQSMNNPENVVEIEKYMTPELYQSIKADVLNNKFVADFSQLDCQLVECDDTNKPQIIASVAFSGLVSEEPTQPTVPFNEMWNFIKYTPDSKWIVAGIQQANSVN